MLIQSYITIGMIPLYAYWGLPFSLLSFIGNFIFIPFLTLFITVSLLFFLGLLFGFPFSIFAYLLEIITKYWLYIMKYFFVKWYVLYFPFKSFYHYLYCWILLLLIAMNRWVQKSLWRSTSFALFFMSFFLIFYSSQKVKKNAQCVVSDRGLISIIHRVNDKNHLFIINGKIEGRKGEYFLYYALMPNMARFFGDIKIFSCTKSR